MNKLSRISKLIIVILGVILIPGWVSAIPVLANQVGSSSLDKLMNESVSFPSCTDKDFYWYQQSGPDSVAITPVESNAAVIQADKITGQNGDAHYASGNVVGYKNDKTIVSDWLIYDQKKAHVTGGNVVMTRQYDVVQGKWLDYYLDLDSGTIKNASVLQPKTDMYASGEQVNVFDKKHYQIESAFMTTCDPNDPAWHITAREANFDYQNSMGNARSGNFYVESTPVAALPYFTFPLGERKSGFLIPVFGGSTSTSGGSTGSGSGSVNPGAYVGIPYYWNMAPDYDMTITPEIYSGAGFFVSDQFRYMNQSGNGELYTEQVPNQWNNGEYRYFYHFLGTQKFESLTVNYAYNKVSDNNYFVAFGNSDSVANNINLDQSISATYQPSWGMVGLKVESFQTLQPEGVNQQVVQIYATLPQFNFNVNPIALGNTPFKMDLVSQYTNFQSPTPSMQSGQRAIFYPSLTMPLKNAWGFITPKVGYDYSNYSLAPYSGIAQVGYSDVNRSVPITSLDSGLIFERPITLGNSNYVQTLEPRLYYLYVPGVNQANLPLFDTSPATYNLNQLYSENRFSGFDRINMANDLTMGISSKLIDDNTGVEFANWGAAYRYYITPENNFLYGSYNQFQELFLPQPNVIAELGNNWSKVLSSNASVQYSTQYQTVDQYALQLRFAPGDYKVLNARFAYQYQQPLLYYAYVPGAAFTPAAYENQYALDISGQWPLVSNRWFAEGRLNYDFTAGVLMNGVAGLEYNGGCWGLHAVVENYITNINQSTTAYYLVLELKGIGNLGPNGDPTSDLKFNIPGYLPTMNTTIH